VDFKKNTKPTQEITKDYTESLEKVIKQRILDEAFYDRQRYTLDPHIKENFAAISQEKSGKGLSDIYEDEFKGMLNLPTAGKDEKLKHEIQGLFKDLCYKLDSLSNLTFAPKASILIAAEIIKNTPAVNFEEKIPIAVSKGSTSRPEELFNKQKDAQFETKDEMETEEKRRLRRAKKRALRTRNKEQDKKKMIKQLAFKGQMKFDYN
jgi:U3 small nucleolar RNA-associated protein MPP10